jgi:hypothetical protein
MLPERVETEWPMFMPVVLANVELYRVAPELSKSKS